MCLQSIVLSEEPQPRNQFISLTMNSETAGGSVTNALIINQGEVGELVYWKTPNSDYTAQGQAISVTINNQTSFNPYAVYESGYDTRPILVGPATVRMWVTNESAIYTWRLTPSSQFPGQVATWMFQNPATAHLLVQDGEVAELLSIGSTDSSRSIMTITINGIPWRSEVPLGPPILRFPLVAGPAQIAMGSLPGATSVATWRISPQPANTQIISAQDGDVAVQMESSTNLLDWTAATNGTYSVEGGAKFFRLRLAK